MLRRTVEDEFVEKLVDVQERLFCYISSTGVAPADVEDVRQKTNVRLWRQKDRYRRGSNFGAWAVTVSGAGSGLIAMCDPSDADAVGAAMHEVFDAGTADPECVGFAVRPSEEGLERLEP